MTRFDPTLTTHRAFKRVPPELVHKAKGLSSSTMHEAAGKVGSLPAAIKPVDPNMRVCGPALPVQSPGGDNLWLHRALYAAEPGDILVVDVHSVYEHGYWGEIMTRAAQLLKIGGLVIDGCVRDGTLLRQMGFPVFSRGLCIRGTGKDFGAHGTIGHPIMVGQAKVMAGDLICGDADGVVCVPSESAAAAVENSLERDATEVEILRRLEAGESTLRIYGWE